MSWDERPDLTAGVYPSGADMEAILDQIEASVDQVDSLTAPGWTSYVPAWTSSASQPALGNGTLTGRYRMAAGSDLIIVEATLTMGSTSTYGTGNYFISLPAMHASTLAAGSAFFLDAGTLERMGAARHDSSSKVVFVTSAGGYVSPTTPHTWAVNDVLRFSVVAQPA